MLGTVLPFTWSDVFWPQARTERIDRFAMSTTAVLPFAHVPKKIQGVDPPFLLSPMDPSSDGNRARTACFDCTRPSRRARPSWCAPRFAGRARVKALRRCFWHDEADFPRWNRLAEWSARRHHRSSASSPVENEAENLERLRSAFASASISYHFVSNFTPPLLSALPLNHHEPPSAAPGSSRRVEQCVG